MSPSKVDNQLAFVHHRQTGEVELRRTGKFPGGAGTPFSPAWHLHFTDDKLSHVCRCPNSKRHKQSSPLALSSTHLASDVAKYLHEHDLEQCSLTTFRKYQRRKHDEWAHGGIFVNDFHYATKSKDVVCRCTKPNNHGQGAVLNTKIQDLCAIFFRASPTEMTCTKAQWRMAGKLPQDHSPLQYEVLQRDRQMSQVTESPGHQDMVDVPVQVWDNARPSVWKVESDSGSSSSTPLGSPVAPRSPGAISSRSTRQRIMPDIPRRDSALTMWSTIQRQAAAGRVVSLEEELKDLSITAGADEPFKIISHQAEAGRAHSQVMAPAQSLPRGSIHSSANVKPLNLSPYGDIMSANQLKVSSQSLDVPVVFSELSGPDTRVKLPPRPTRPELFDQLESPKPQHSADLHELEAVRRDSPHEDYAGEYLQLLDNRTSSSKSQTTQPSGKLATLFIQVTDALDLPNQEDFLLRHVAIFSRAQPAPLNDCVLCAEPLIHRQKRTIQLHCCGQFLHEACLVAHFRFRDESLGHCPICNMAVCKRDLADRLDTDRKAIFESGFTEVHDTFRMSFPHRNEAAHLKSEEELATAQLRLLKDLVQAHADEFLSTWDLESKEPEWHPDIVRPSVKLWKGWNSSYSPSRFFTDRDAFLSLLAWAELVRLVNNARPVLQQASEDVVQPPLSELHRKLQWAKGRYDREKRTWKLNQSGALDCEMIAQDVYDMAMRTHHSNAP